MIGAKLDIRAGSSRGVALKCVLKRKN
jgi:hypothetical protein